MKVSALTVIFLTSLIVPMNAQTHFESGSPQTTLVELYTSEGCSSCPPAEAWLSRLKDDPGLWKSFVPVAFHVDYWDRLGWPDRFSSARWTQRQSRYAAQWGNDSVYTPAVVANGHEERAWSRVSFSAPNEKPAGKLSATTSDGKSFSVTYEPAASTVANWDCSVALLGAGLSTQVGAGENRGRNLQHDFVVLDLQRAEMKSAGASSSATVNLSWPAEKTPRRAVAVWVAPRGQQAPAQATGGWLR